MNAFILFLLRSIFVSGLLAGWYWLGLRNRRLHEYNRYFLLLALPVSLLVPLLHFQWFHIPQKAATAASPATYILHMADGMIFDEPGIRHQAATGIDWGLVAMGIVITISASLLSLLLLRVTRIIKMSRKYTRTEMDGVSFILTDLPNAPFSFLHYLFWSSAISMETDNGRLIYRHELTHITQRHTYDKLACQALTCIFWMNPFFWIIQKELGMIHEFIADDKALTGMETGQPEGIADAFARMLLATHNSGRYLIPEHQFFSSPIKRRLTMLQKNTKTSHPTMRRMAVLPLLAGAIFLFSFTVSLGSRPVAIKAAKKIVLVLDAGHGGDDAGATQNGLAEKDLNLRIAQHIKDLSPEYNVEVHLTRSKDETMSLADRVALSNSLHPDYFISVHVNYSPVQEQVTDEFSVAIVVDKYSPAKESISLAKCVYDNTVFLGKPNQQQDRYTRKGLYVLRNNKAPSILLEIGDIKSKKQMQHITDPASLDELCAAILKGVVATNKG